MRKCKVNSKRGFTIIEVVLVLAIAGLIFLMVFLALPALQRAQKDTQRRDQLSMLVTQLTQYQANNRNRLPNCGTSTTPKNPPCYVVPDSDGKVTGNGGWETFYRNYLLAQNDVFEDPNGNPYKLQVVDCEASENECAIQRFNWGFDSDASSSTPASTDGNTQSGLTGVLATTDLRNLLAVEGSGNGGGGDNGPTNNNQNYYILITIGASCDGEAVVKNTGARRVSVAYKLEGGGTFCENN